MNLEFLVNELVQKANKINNANPFLRWYLFGSILVQPRLANDIDLLIIYQKEIDPGIVRKELNDVLISNPLHITFLLEAEDEELNFLNQQVASLIFKG